MSTLLRAPLRLLAITAALVLPACGGGGGDAGMASEISSAVATYAVTNLVSDDSAAGNPLRGAHADPHLVDAWGVAFNPQGFVWVANAGTSTATLYDGNGVPQTLVVTIPPGDAGSARPTGIVFSGKASFKVSQNGVSAASVFLFAGEAGTLSGWSPGVNPTNAVTVVDDGPGGTVYKGLAIASRGTSDFLFAADFGHSSVDVFDGNFNRVAAPGAFVDPGLPDGYAPHGIQAIGDRVYVAYARKDFTARNALAGPGLGIVDVFDTAGAMIRRLVSEGGALNAPWGIVIAPANFGVLSSALLVSNSGDGRINAFNAETGAFIAALSTANGSAFAFDGLHGIAFGNDRSSQPSNTLFFAAGPGGGAHGLYGRTDSR